MQVLRLDHFAARLNEEFTVEMDHGATPFMLVEARPVGGTPVVGASREPFALLFHNAAAILFPQRTYTMRHDSMGEFGIFLVPVARNADGFIYQALFN